MADLLLWLALPLLTIPWLTGAQRPGAAASCLVMAGFGLAALQLGAGTLDPGDLRGIAGQSSSDAWFVAMTAGLMISGCSDWTALRDRFWLPVIATLPLAIGLVLSAAGHPLPLVVGLVLGLVPRLLGRVATGTGRSGGEAAAGAAGSRVEEIDAASVALALATALAALIGPALLALLGVVALTWRARLRLAEPKPRYPVLPVVGTVLLGVWGWFALTIAGAPLASFRTLTIDAPISPAAEPGLALIAIAWGVALAAPWPLDRSARVAVQLPVVAVVLHLAGLQVTPDGIAHWQPVLSVVLVVATLAAMVTRRWDGAAAAVMLLGVTRSGALPFAGGLALAVVPTIRCRLTPSACSALAGVALAGVVAGMLADQVLLSAVLAMGAATLAQRRDYVVARAERPVHL